MAYSRGTLRFAWLLITACTPGTEALNPQRQGKEVLGAVAEPAPSVPAAQGAGERAAKGAQHETVTVEALVAQPSNPACLAPIAGLPKSLPDAPTACLAPAYAFALAPHFFDPPSKNAIPCALEVFDREGRREGVASVERFDPRERRIRFVERDPNYPVARTVNIETERFDRRGRRVSLHVEDQDFYPGDKEPDCVDTSMTRYDYDKQGRPSRTEQVTETCDGTDERHIETQRTFTWPEGFAVADLQITNRVFEEQESGTEWWIPAPTGTEAMASCDEEEDCTCRLTVRGCDGTELGWVQDNGGGMTYQRWRWVCDAQGMPVPGLELR